MIIPPAEPLSSSEIGILHKNPPVLEKTSLNGVSLVLTCRSD